MWHPVLFAVLLLLPSSIRAANDTFLRRRSLRHDGDPRDRNNGGQEGKAGVKTKNAGGEGGKDGSRYSLFGFTAADRTHVRDRFRGSNNAGDEAADRPKLQNRTRQSWHERYRNNHQDKEAKQESSHQAMGDPSALQGLANEFAEEVNITLLADTPYLQRFAEHSPIKDGEAMEAFLKNEMQFRDSFSDLPTRSSETQRVYLDFSNEGNYTALVNGVLYELPVHVFTLEEQFEILDRIKADYAGFNVEFAIDADISSFESPDDVEDVVGDAPFDGEYSTIKFNEEITPFELEVVGGKIGGFSLTYGVADSIDFLNVNRNDTALVNNNFWELLVTVDPTGGLLASVTGATINGPADVKVALSDAVVNQSSNTGAHELAHIMGMSHLDAIGAIGDGLPFFVPPDGAFVPSYSGQRNATETVLHLLATGTSLGLPFGSRASLNQFFSERSAIKLTLAEGKGDIISEAEAKNGIIELPSLDIPNTIIEGENAGTKTIAANALVITGVIEEFPETDRFRLRLEEGTFLTAEVSSTRVLSVSNPVATRLAIFSEDEDGTLVEIYNNTQVFEPFDPVMIDVPITETGTYVIDVIARREVYADTDGDRIIDTNITLPLNSAFLTGDYWLLLYHLDPELTSAGERAADSGQSQEPVAAPTSSPTVPPSSEPTFNPTMPPTDSPTAAPTAKATRTKRVASTPEPTAMPPTESPTATPTATVTRTKRSAPTPEPTTAQPSFEPTMQPSSEPTMQPSLSSKPSSGPSLAPSSGEPTLVPTDKEILDLATLADADLVSDRNQGPIVPDTSSAADYFKVAPKPSEHKHQKKPVVTGPEYYYGRYQHEREHDESMPFLAWLPTSTKRQRAGIGGRNANP